MSEETNQETRTRHVTWMVTFGVLALGFLLRGTTVANAIAYTTAVVVGFVLGLAAALAAYIRFYRNPEKARELMKAMYRKAHPHWLQRSQSDETPVCPCCGWSETESIAGHG